MLAWGVGIWFAGLVSLARGQTASVSYNTENAVYSQNFGSFLYVGAPSSFTTSVSGVAGTTIDLSQGTASLLLSGLASNPALTGWYASGAAANRVGYNNGAGDTSTAAVFNFNNGSQAGLGLVSTSATGTQTFGLMLVNNTGHTLNQVNLSFLAEEWRVGSATSTNSLVFGYTVTSNLAATLPTSNLLTDAALNFTSPVTGASAFYSNAPTSPALSATKADSLTNLNWINGQALWLEWSMPVLAQGPGLAISNFSLSASVGIANLTWNNQSGDRQWNQTSANWNDGSTSLAYSSGANVTFSDAGAGTVTITSLGVAPGSVTVTNSGNNTYTLVGGAVAGAASLTKTGSGRLVLAPTSVNSYAGGTFINAGTLQVGSAGALPATGAVTLANASSAVLDLHGFSITIGSLAGGGTSGGTVLLGNNTLTLGNATDTTYSGSFSGTGGIVKQGSGTFTIDNSSTVSNPFMGGITILSGTLALSPATNVAQAALRGNALTLSPGAALDNPSSRKDPKTGEWNGAGTISAGATAGFFMTPMTSASSSATVIAGPGGGVGPAGGGFNVRSGMGTQTLSGDLSGVNAPLAVHGVGLGGGMFTTGVGLTGNAALTAANAQVVLRGGSVTLDNSTQNVARLGPAIPVMFTGGGKLALIGNPAGTTLNVGSLTVTAGASILSVQNSSSSVGTQLGFNNGATNFSLRGDTSMVINFVGTGGTLGAAGANPRIVFTGGGVPFLGAGGLLANSTGSNQITVGWATVNTTEWATYGAGGITAVTPTKLPTNASGLQGLAVGDVVVYSPSSNQTISGTITAAALKIAPAGDNLSLNTGGNTLSTNVLMLAGSRDFTISGGGSLGAGSGTKYVYVTDAHAKLTTDATLAGNNHFNKAGDGFLVLNGSNQNQVAAGTRINLLAGTLRAGNAQLGTAGIVAFRGGVLEISGGGASAGASADFTRSLGSGGSAVNAVNWTSSSTDRGNGGFSAFGSNASVNLGGNATPTTLTWDATANFIQNGYALLFGSSQSNARIDFLNPLAMDGIVGVQDYNARQIYVFQGAGGDSARLAGVVSGSPNTDLYKAGPGTLELAAANTYLGGTYISQGTLLLSTSTALGDAANTTYVLLGNRGGADDAALMTNAAVTIDRELTLQAGNTGTMTLGGNLNVNSTFSGNIVLNHDVNLFSMATGGNATSFTGSIFGTGAVNKVGPGVVVFGGPNRYTGGTTVVAGTLQLLPGSSLGTGPIYINAGAAITAASLLAPGQLTNNGLINAGVTIAAGGALAGTGTINGSVTMQSGSTYAPGNSPGMQTVNGDATWNTMTYSMQVADVLGAQGVGYDSLDVNAAIPFTGKLSITPGATIDINLDSYPTNSAVANFNDLTPFDLILVSTDGGVTGFGSAIFSIHTAGFASGNPFTGMFSIVQSGNDLLLHYAAVPEPGTLLLGSLAGVVIAIRARRRSNLRRAGSVSDRSLCSFNGSGR